MSVSRRCWAEINLDALRHNVAAVRGLIGGARIMAIVKANAYGHGLCETVKALSGAVEMFGVANLGEALQLREALPAANVFVLGPALPEEREELVRSGFVPTVSSAEEAAAYARLAERVQVHFVIDTGMGRMGAWQDDAIAVAREILAMPQIEIAGIATHLPLADEDEAFTEKQLQHFETLVAQLESIGLRKPLVHSLNSAGVIHFSRHSQEMVRAGLMLYGVSPLPDFQKNLRPVMTLKTRVTQVRDVAAGHGISYGRTFVTEKPMRVATLAIGYADGYQRHLSNRGAEVLIRGRRCAVLGRVTMDQIMADATALTSIAPGEEVVLIGRQGDEEILATELAQKAGTIAWEIFTGIKGRVERLYISD